MKRCLSFSRIVALLFPAFIAGPIAARAQAVDPLAHVDPFIGTGGHGHTFPGATLPFGMVQLSPDTRLEGWDGCSGYHYDDDRIFGFSHTHLSGTGVGDLCDILFYPFTGEIKWENGWRGEPGAPSRDTRPAELGYGSHFRKETESASPGYYAVTLDQSGTRVELTATLRAGMHRYTFSASDSARVLIDLTHRDKLLASELRVVSSREIEGMRRSSSWARDQAVYFVAQFSEPFTASLALGDSVPAYPNVVGRDIPEAKRMKAGGPVKAALAFAPGARLTVKVGISSVSSENARRNLETEIPGWDFDAVQAAARETWRQALARVEIEGGTPAEQTIFYTALYHTLLQPNTYSDVDGRDRIAGDRVLHADGYTRYTTFSLWDTFRAAHPLYTIIEPARTVDFIRSMLGHFEETGRLPVWELWGNETDCMIGYHAASVITDAYAKGIRGFDAELALTAMRASAERDTPGLNAYRKFGYIPSDVESESVSKTLEYAYDDWCISEFAYLLDHPEGHSDIDSSSETRPHQAVIAAYRLRAKSWMNLLDPVTGFMRPKSEARFKPLFQPTDVDFNFTEANSWQYSFFVPHDVEHLAAQLGGDEPLRARLDSLFAASSQTTGRTQADITGLIGQYAHGNEPSHHIAYLYSVAGQPWRTQERVREIMSTMYAARPDGLAGNEDCGQMSAWYVLSALGFYSVLPGDSRYVIGSPLFQKATIHQENGKEFVVQCAGAGPFIKAAGDGAEPYQSRYLPHALVTEGFRLNLELGETADPGWSLGPLSGGLHSAKTLSEPYLAAPYVAGGDSPFRDSTRVVLAYPASAEPSGEASTSRANPATIVRARRIHYTLDGTTPSVDSPVYTSPIPLSATTTIRFVATFDLPRRSGEPGIGSYSAPTAPGSESAYSSPVQESTFHRWSGNRRLLSGTEASPQYPGDSREALVDGVRGGPDFRLGAWQGFEGKDMEAVIDLGETTEIHRLALGCLQDQNSWIFMPARVSFELSLDGTNFTPAGTATSGVDPHADGGILRECEVRVKDSLARYVRVRAESLRSCPAWHKGAGNPCWIFIDEVTAE
ncbi:MAG: GH92 family glycosyl hydrolase [Candidatus Eisenbacteria bacterium]